MACRFLFPFVDFNEGWSGCIVYSGLAFGFGGLF